MTITITPEIERGLTEEAQRQGMTPETLALYALQERFGADIQETQKDTPESSAYNLFAGRIGRIHGGGGNWSEDTGTKFADGMEEKRRQGHL